MCDELNCISAIEVVLYNRIDVAVVAFNYSMSNLLLATLNQKCSFRLGILSHLQFLIQNALCVSRHSL